MIRDLLVGIAAVIGCGGLVTLGVMACFGAAACALAIRRDLL